MLRGIEMAATYGEKGDTGGIAPWLISAWVAWTILLISTFGSVCVIFRIDHGPWEGTDRMVLSVAICAIVASVLAWMSYEAPAFFRHRTPRLIKSPNARYFLNLLLSMLLAWSVCVFGQVCAFMGLPLEIVTPVFFGATWLLFAFHFPTKTKMIRWADGSAVPRAIEAVALREAASMTVTAMGALHQLFVVLRARWWALLAAAGTYMFPSAIISFLLMRRRAGLETLGRFDTNIDWVVTAPFIAAASGATVLLAMGALAGRELGIASSIAGSLRRLVSLVIAVVLIWTVTWIGFLLLVVPGVILSVRLAVAMPVLMVEGVGPLEALRRAWALSGAHQLAIFGALLPVWLVVCGLPIAAVLPFLDFGADWSGNPIHGLSTASIALMSGLSWCTSTIATVLHTTLATVFYTQIREQDRAE
jgi:hypothetical protein